MSFKIKSISINELSINHQLLIEIEFSYEYKFEYPLVINGFLLTATDNKQISTLYEYKQYERDIAVNTMDRTTRANNSKEYSYTTYTTKLYAELNHKTIEHIEKVREKHQHKDIEFRVELQIKKISSTYNFNEQQNQIKQNNEIRSKQNQIMGSNLPYEQVFNVPFLDITILNEQANFKIAQSDWINKFVEKIGIGKFILLELNSPQVKEFEDEKWKDLYIRLIERVNQIEEFIQKGEWYAALTPIRQFYENLKFNNSKSIHREFKEELKELFKTDNHSDESFNLFYDGIEKFFNFSSKYIHDKNNTDGQLNPVPVANKEDVYLCYSLAISILNLIGRKLSNSKIK